jgi:hypothetical protein
VDITADQFHDVPQRIIVIGTSAFHTRFEDQRRRPPGIDAYSCAPRLWCAYRAIVDIIGGKSE